MISHRIQKPKTIKARRSNWQKRLRPSPDGSKGPAKQTKLNTYWLSHTPPIPTSNSFARFIDNDTQENNNEQREKTIKSPPIFVDNVENI